MQLTIEQAAERLGKSVRQVRYLIQNGVLHATKTGGRWLSSCDRAWVREAGASERGLRSEAS